MMTHFHSLETSISATTNLSLFHTPFSPSKAVLPLSSSKSLAMLLENSKKSASRTPTRTSAKNPATKVLASGVSTAEVDGEADVEVAEGYTITQFCDKMIDLFLYEKPKSKYWRKYLVFREEWRKYGDRFYSRCRTRADTEVDSQMKEKLISLARKVRKIDDEMERHTELLKEIQDNPRDLNAIVTKRRKDFNGEFFRHLTLLSETYNSLEDRDAFARLGTRCLSAVSAYDNTLEIVGTLDTAQAKLDDILNSPSVDAACDKIKSLAKSKELDSSLVLLINGAWASAKESSTMRNEVRTFVVHLIHKDTSTKIYFLKRNAEFHHISRILTDLSSYHIMVKEIMHRLYKATQSSLRSMAPKEIKLLKYLLNITDPEERFSALATAFSPGHEHDAKDPNAIYTSPKELHKWIKIMLDAYNMNKEETEIREAKQLDQPMVIQRLSILKETVEAEYLEKEANTEKDSQPEETVI